MPNLKDAVEQGKLDQFIKQHKGEKGDKALFDATLSAMAGKSPKAPKASSRAARDD